MTASRRRIVGRISAAAVVALLVAGCASTESPGSAAAPSAPEGSATTSAAASPGNEPSATPTPSRSSARPSPSNTKPPPKVDLGTVTNTTSTKKSGKGSAELVLHRKGKSFGIVMQFDCSKCKGSFVLTEADRMTPFGRTTAPVKGAYLVNIDKKQADKQTYLLTASGSWKITVLSWNQLPVVTGKQSGKGSDVLYLGDRASALKVTAKPAGKGDEFGARVFTVSAKPLIFGNDEAFTETYDTDLPGVIAIRTNGTWSITPKR